MKLNNEYAFPGVEVPKAMKRVIACESAIFLVSEVYWKAIGLVRGIHDGSRALIHQISVHPRCQGQGIGTALLKEIVKMFNERRASTVSALTTEESLGF